MVIKYFLEKMASSTNQAVGMQVILGLSHQLIQKGQSEFNIEQNQHDLTPEETHPFSTIKLNSY
jgi:hypothetical protein